MPSLHILVVLPPHDRRLPSVLESLATVWQITQTSPAEVVNTLADRQWDGIVLSMTQLDADGLQTLQLLQLQPVPIVVLAEFIEEAIALAALKQGAQDVLDLADLTANRLKRAVHFAIERHQRHSNAIDDRQMIPFFEKQGSDAINVISKTAQFLYVNDATCRALGYTRAELLSMTVHDVDPNYPPEVWQAHWQRMQQCGSIIEESINRTRDGQKLPVEISINHFEFNGQEALCTIIRDISERKAAAKALQESERKFRTLVENLPGVVYRCLDDAQWTDLFISDEVERLTGYPAQDFTDRRRSFEAITHPDDIDLVRQRVEEALPQKQSFAIEYRIYHRDGSLRWVYEQGQGNWDEQGNLLHIDGVLIDISARKAIEQALQESEARLHAVLNNANALIYLKDVQGRYLLANHHQLRLRGLVESEVIGKTDFDLYAPEVAEAYRRNDEEVLSAGVSMEFEEYAFHPDGIRTYLSVKFPLFDASGAVYAIGGVSTDITTRKRAEAEVLRALAKEKDLNELRSRFLSITSHEFRTPLTTILGSTELLEYSGHKWPEEKKHKHYRQIKGAVQHLTRLLDDVLTFSQSEAGMLSFNPVPLNLVGFCQELVEEIQLGLGKQHLLQTHWQPDSRIEALMDEKLLRQILSNLLSNACKYSPPGSPITFHLLCDRETAVFQIRDVGIGIPTADRPHLFQPFHRAENVGTTAGTGLGLAIVKRAVDVHGGTIVIESEVGLGTLCTVTLPLRWTPVQPVPSLKLADASTQVLLP